MNLSSNASNWVRWILLPAVAAALTAVVMLQLAAGGRFADRDLIPPPPATASRNGPSSRPDRIVLTWTGPTGTTQTVTWRTSASYTRAVAEICEASPGPDLGARARRIEAVTRAVEIEGSKWSTHTAKFNHLLPGTKYAYRVGGESEWSEWFQFRTPSESPEPFYFIYLGDAQNDIRDLWSRVIREAYSDAPHPAFILHAGDLVNHGESDLEWSEWFESAGFINAMVPVVATPGNHEYVDAGYAEGKKLRRLSGHWPAQFAFPVNGPPGLESTVYYLDYQNLRVISLDSNERQDQQIAWLDAVLSENGLAWTVITFHHPIFSPAQERDNPELRAAWKPVFDRHRVDLVLSGHDHSYGRTGLIAGDTNAASGSDTRVEPTGTVYVTSVSGPKMYDLAKVRLGELSRVAEQTQLYQIIHIDGDTLTYEARMANGERYDGFALKKHAGRRNEFIEQVPEYPERRALPGPAATLPVAEISTAD